MHIHKHTHIHIYMHTPWRDCKYDLREVGQHFMCHSSRYTSKWSFHHQRWWKMDNYQEKSDLATEEWT